MAKENEKTYIDFVNDILSSLSNNELYLQFRSFLEQGESKLAIHHRYTSKRIDVDWVSFIEDCIISFDNVVRNPKKFIAQEEEVISTSLARSITTDSIKHLAQHTNLVNIIDGEIKPEKILNIRKEESYQVYENRFAWTLLQRLSHFIDLRFAALNKTIENAEEIKLENNVQTQEKGKSFNYKLEMDHLADLTPEDIENLDRIEKIKSVISGFYSSNFAKQMKGSEPVRPPIVRTNSILKNPDYQKLLQLWQFVETYEKEGYSEETKEEDLAGTDDLNKNLSSTMFLNYLLLKTLIKNEKKQEIEEEDEEEKKIQNERIRTIEKIIERYKKEASLRDPYSDTAAPEKEDGEKTPIEGENGEIEERPKTYEIQSSPTGDPRKVEDDQTADEVKYEKIESVGKIGVNVYPKQSLSKSRLIREFIERAIVEGDLDDIDIVAIQRRLTFKKQVLTKEQINKINAAIDRTLDEYYHQERLKEIERKEKLNEKRKEEERHISRLLTMISENHKAIAKEVQSERKIIEKAIKREKQLTDKIDQMLQQQEKLKEQIAKLSEEIQEEQNQINKLKDE